jgi:hypothetical protein
MAVMVESVDGLRKWCEVDWIDSHAYFNHISTRYRVDGLSLVIVALLPRPGDGSDQPTLFPLPPVPPATVKPAAKQSRGDQPTLF